MMQVLPYEHHALDPWITSYYLDSSFQLLSIPIQLGILVCVGHSRYESLPISICGMLD